MHPEAIDSHAKRSLEQLISTDIFSDFYLAGGTAAAIQLGHRVSVDLDLFTKNDFEPDRLRERLKSQSFTLQNYAPDKNTINAVHEQTKVSFLGYSYPLIEDLIEFKGAKLASLTDIALMKMTAIASRGSKKDFVDLVRIFDELGLDIIVDSFSKKYPVQEMDLYHYSKSLTFFDDADLDPDPIMLVDFDWNMTKEKMKAYSANLSLE